MALTGNFRCQKSGSGSTAVHILVTMRRFFVTCPKVNRLCNKKSNAFVAAATICSQRLYV